MSTQNTVEVFLGNPIEVQSEQDFLARLQRDLTQSGVFARVLGNLQLGRRARQIDFIVITDQRVVQVELKTFSGPIVSAPANGDWTIRVGASSVKPVGNPAAQARGATFAVSDSLEAFARRRRVPGPTLGKYYKDIDTVVCVFPELHVGSVGAGTCEHVTVLGYLELLARLRTPGPRVPFAPADWDRFGQHLNLYRAADDSAEGVLRRMGTAAVDAYLGLYLADPAEAVELVETAVLVDEQAAERVDLADELTAGRAVLLHGPSGYGKTLRARTVAAALARTGHVPIWLGAEVSDPSLRTSLARAISPYTSLAPKELLQAAHAAGRSVVFILDDLTKASEAVRDGLLDGARTMRLRDPGLGVLMTAQDRNVADAIPELRTVELLTPDDDERRALLRVHGATELIDRCDAFVSPLELALAAEYAGTLTPGASTAELIDAHVDRMTGGDPAQRRALRVIAHRIYANLVPSLPRPDLARVLGRDHDLTARDLDAVWACPLLHIAHGRVALRHDRFERFLAAEQLLLATPDADALARALNTPRYAALAADVIALEPDKHRLGELLSSCEHADVMTAAADGALGARAAAVADTILTEALKVACAQTTATGITFTPGDPTFAGAWTLPDPLSRAANAQLTAIGNLLPRWRFVEGVSRLLELTDELCASAITNADGSRQLADIVFASTYVFSGRPALPATAVVNAARETAMMERASLKHAGDVAAGLLDHREPPGLGALLLAAELLRRAPVTARTADVIVRCLNAGRYHLLLAGLDLAEERAHVLRSPARETVLAAVRALPMDNIILNGAIIEALEAFGDITPARSEQDVEDEIELILSKPDDPLHRKRAYGAVSAQFETEAIGPYYQVISGLPGPDRQRLLAMAVDGCDTGGFAIGWILNAIDDLSDPFTRAIVERYVARTDPEQWGMIHAGKEGIVSALRLLSAEPLPLPAPTPDGNHHPAWRAALTIIHGALRDAAGHPVDQPAIDAAWTILTSEHRDRLASLLHNLRGVQHLSNRHTEHVDVLAAMPPAGIDALVWSLEHPEQIQPLCRFDHDMRPFLVALLGELAEIGEIGDRRAVAALRNLINDPELGVAAATAVRTIEIRALT